MPRSLNSASVGVDPLVAGRLRVLFEEAVESVSHRRSSTMTGPLPPPSSPDSPLASPRRSSFQMGTGLSLTGGDAPLCAASSALVFRLGRGPASAASLARTGFMSERAQRPVVVVTRLRRRPARAERDPGLIACRRSGRNRKADVMPPSSGKAAPVMKPASSLARYATVPASSSSVPKRPIG